MNGKWTNHVLLAVLGILVLLLNTSPTLAYSNGMTKQDFVNFIDGRTINFDAMYHGGWNDETPDIWITPGTYSMAYMHINSAGKLWYISISSKSSNIIIYGDDSSNILTDTIPDDVFTAATNALAPYLITTYIAPKSAPVRYIAPAPTPTPYIAPAPTQQKTKQDFVNFIGGRNINYDAMYYSLPSSAPSNTWAHLFNGGGYIIVPSIGGSLFIHLACYNPASDPNQCISYQDLSYQDRIIYLATIPADVFNEATNALSPYLINK